MRLRMNYEEWLKNYEDENWSGWKIIDEIEKSTNPPRSRLARENPRFHAMMFLNNYLLEKEVLNFLNRNGYNVRFNGDDHLDWIEGRGLDTPDYIDDKGRTFELKQTGSLDMFCDYACGWNWHGADVRLVYIRDLGTLYQMKGNELKVFAKNLRYTMVYLPAKKDDDFGDLFD